MKIMKNSTLKAAKNRLQGLAHSVQFNGNIPIPSANGTGLCSANGGIVPPILVQEDRVPKFYQDAIAFCGATSSNQLPNTALVYNLMVTSQLPRDVLGNIWSLVNRTLPGQLTRHEFYECLALIALAQRGQSLAALCEVTSLPIPYFQTFKANEKPGKNSTSEKTNSKQKSTADRSGPSMATKSAPVQHSKNNLVNGTHAASSSHNKQTNKTAFVPTELLDGAGSSQGTSTMKLRQEDDLLGLFASSSIPNAQNGSLNGQSTSAAKNGLTEIAELFEFRAAPAQDEAKSGSDAYVSFNLEVETKELEIPNEKMNGTLQSSTSNSSEQVDPYAALRFNESINISHENECIDIWKQVLDQAYHVINDSITMLQRTPSLTTELLETEKGFQFIESVHAMYQIVTRIRKTMKMRSIEDSDLVQKCDEAEQLWSKFLSSETGQSFLNLHKHSSSTNGATEQIVQQCGICLQSLVEERLRIEFVGRFYHTPCANFWINRINSLLPKLE